VPLVPFGSSAQPPTHQPDGEAKHVEAQLRDSEERFRTLFDLGPVAVYYCAASGIIENFNRRAAELWGRAPVRGDTFERFCGSYKMYRLDGSFLPHQDCPMAVAIREKRAVRGAVAAAERPDGTRVMFTPYPTPLIGEDGDIAGAVNILIDMTDRRQASALRAQAMRCRRLAQSLTDQQAVDTLLVMAGEYDDKAQSLRPD